jgi:hypothetical protein
MAGQRRCCRANALHCSTGIGRSDLELYHAALIIQFGSPLVKRGFCLLNVGANAPAFEDWDGERSGGRKYTAALVGIDPLNAVVGVVVTSKRKPPLRLWLDIPDA